MTFWACGDAWIKEATFFAFLKIKQKPVSFFTWSSGLCSQKEPDSRFPTPPPHQVPCDVQISEDLEALLPSVNTPNIARYVRKMIECQDIIWNLSLICRIQEE